MNRINRTKALIFALPRTGSTSIYRALNAHPGIRCSYEPFNSQTELDSRERIRKRLDSLWVDYFAIKHVWHSSGWPFGMKMELNWFLLTEGAERVIFLRRKNLLKRVISCELCMQANLWNVKNTEALASYRKRKFAPLNIESIRRSVQEDLDLIEEGRRRLATAKACWTEFMYEELYDTTGAREEAFCQLFDFLGIASLSPPWTELRRVIDRPVSRLNDESVYKRVPNIWEVETRIGADATGWLFR